MRTPFQCPKSAAAERFAECKQTIAGVARSFTNVRLIDFRLAGPIATEDTNFWDLTHYRELIARQLEQAVATVVTEEGTGDTVRAAAFEH